MNRIVLAASVLGMSVVPTLAGISGQQVVSYTQGNVAPSLADYTNLSAAVGVPAGDTGYGALTPFNPHFGLTEILGIGENGSATIRLSAPVLVNAQAKIGVFSNAGVQDDDPTSTFDQWYTFLTGGRGIVGSPVTTFGGGTAIVSVSSDGVNFVPVTGTPTIFNTPHNAYTDNDVNLGLGTIGNAGSDYFKPFSGSVNDFAGLRYRDPSDGPDILKLLDGSAGGTWLDISGVGLSSVQYVRFDVPASGRMIIDAVTAVPEPASASWLLGSLLCLRRRRL